MSRGNAVGEAMRAARVLGDVSANRACALARRIGGVIEPETAHLATEVEVDEARLHDCQAVYRIDLEDPAHTRGDDNDAALARERAARKSGAGATGNDGQAGGACDFDDGRHLLGA